MSNLDMSGPHPAISREPADYESRDCDVSAKPRGAATVGELCEDSSIGTRESVPAVADNTAAVEANTLASLVELGYDMYIFGRGSGTDLVIDEDT